MPRYLSPEWIDEVDAAASTSGPLSSTTAETDLTVQQEVTGGPDGDVSFHVVVHHGAVSVVPGRADRPDVTFVQDHATAVAIGRGELSAQAAFMVGKLQIDGDLERLLDQHQAFAELSDVFGEVRARTTWPAD